MNEASKIEIERAANGYIVTHYPGSRDEDDEEHCSVYVYSDESALLAAVQRLISTKPRSVK